MADTARPHQHAASLRAPGAPTIALVDRLLERENELAELERLLAQAPAGRGSLVLIGAEAGAGKTALVRAFEARAGEVALWRSHCEPLSVPIPLAPVRELAAAAGVPDGGERLELSRGLREALTKDTTVVVLEDLHWADAATLDVVRLLAGWVERGGAVVLATYRDDELGGTRT